MAVINQNYPETPSVAGEAAEEPPQEPQRFETANVVTVAAAHGAHDTYFAFLPPLLPLLIEKLAMTKAEAGLLTVFWQMPALFQPLIGHLADRVNLRYLIIFAPAASAVLISLVGLAPGYAATAFLLLIAGFSSSGLHAVAPAMVGRYSGKKLGRGMSFFMVGGELGFALGPLAVVAVVQDARMANLPWLMIFGILVTVVLFFRLKEAPALATTAAPAHSMRIAIYHMRGILLKLAVITFLWSFLWAYVGTYLPTFMTGEGSGLVVAGASFSVVELAATAGTLASGWASDRVGRRILLVISSVLTPIFTLLFLTSSGWLRLPFLISIGLFAYSTTPLFMALMQSSYPENRALANSVYMTINFVMRSLVVVLVGFLADRFGLRPGFIASAFIWLLALPFVFMLPKK